MFRPRRIGGIPNWLVSVDPACEPEHDGARMIGYVGAIEGDEQDVTTDFYENYPDAKIIAVRVIGAYISLSTRAQSLS
jgi:hypothetical protein